MMVMDLLIVGVAGSQVTSEAAKKIPSVDDDDKKGLKTYFLVSLTTGGEGEVVGNPL